MKSGKALVRTPTYDNLIGGEWVKGSVIFPSSNPADWRKKIGNFPVSTSVHVYDAVGAAKEAYKKWRLVPAPKRAEIIFKTGEILTRRKEELAHLMTREMGKNLKETRGDVQEAVDMCYFIAGEGRRLYGETTPSELPDKFAMSVRMPMGVVAVITPWNFPIAIPSWKIAPALVAGNTVVFKPAEDTPYCAQVFVEILLDAGLDKYPGVLNLIHGYGEEAGAWLVNNSDVSLVSFTGSSETGKIVAVRCAEQYKRVSLEMGGKNITIVMDDADLDLASESCAWGAFGTAGQRCTASSRIAVHKDVLNKFVEKFLTRVKSMKIGNGLDPTVDVGPLINETALGKVRQYIDIAKLEGAKILCGGNRLKTQGYKYGFFHELTVLLAEDPNVRVNQEEIFGPVTSIIPVSSLEEAVEVANGVEYGLSTAILTTDIRNAFRAMRDLDAGITYINSSTIGAEVHLPFGGTKRTGNGHREGGHVLDVFTEWKTVYVDYSGKLQKAQMEE